MGAYSLERVKTAGVCDGGHMNSNGLENRRIKSRLSPIVLGPLLLLGSQNAVQENRRFLSEKHLTSPNKRPKENDIGASQLNAQPYLPTGDLVVLKPHPQYTVAIMLFSALVLNINKHPRITRHLK